MNKAQKVKQLAQQTIEQEQDFQQSLMKEISEIRNQQLIHGGVLKWMMGKMQEKPDPYPTPDFSPILVELAKVLKSYQRMKAYLMICFFAILIPFGSVVIALLVYYLVTK